jgi:hypothetical protein
MILIRPDPDPKNWIKGKGLIAQIPNEERKSSVVFRTDFIADPDPAFYLNADPDPDPGQTLRSQ